MIITTNSVYVCKKATAEGRHLVKKIVWAAEEVRKNSTAQSILISDRKKRANLICRQMPSYLRVGNLLSSSWLEPVHACYMPEII